MVFKGDTCVVCTKTVYALEKISVEEKVYHKNCLRCGHCDKILSLGNYAGVNGLFYCKPHFKQLFALKGNYSDGFKTAEGSDATPKKSTSFTPLYGSSTSFNTPTANASSTSSATPNMPRSTSIATRMAAFQNGDNIAEKTEIEAATAPDSDAKELAEELTSPGRKLQYQQEESLTAPNDQIDLNIKLMQARREIQELTSQLAVVKADLNSQTCQLSRQLEATKSLLDSITLQLSSNH